MVAGSIPPGRTMPSSNTFSPQTLKEFFTFSITPMSLSCPRSGAAVCLGGGCASGSVMLFTFSMSSAVTRKLYQPSLEILTNRK